MSSRDGGPPDGPPEEARGPLEEIAVTVATEAAALAREVRDRVVARAVRLDTKSSATDVVTEGDRACEELVRRRLAALRPDDVVLGEEGGAGAPPRAGQVRWVVDPIDGTVNYTRGLPWYAVSLGAELDGRAVAGAVVEPVSGRVWSATRGGGARCDGSALAVSALERLELAVVATGLGYDPGRRARQGALLGRIAGHVGDVRRTGCASLDLCAVAAGWVDAYYEHGLQRWDWCAGALVAQEAGATVSLPGGAGDRPDPAHDGGADLTLAAPPALAPALAALLSGHGAREV